MNIFDGVVHSRCVQMRVGAPGDAAEAFNRTGTPDIVLVAVPPSPSCCFQFPGVSVPSGFWVLWQRWYKNQGQLDPGFKCAAQRPRPRSTAAMEKQGRAHGRPSPASFLAGFVGPFTIGSRTSSPSRSSRTALRRARRAPTPARARAPPHSARPTLARWRGRGGRPDGHIAVRAMWW